MPAASSSAIDGVVRYAVEPYSDERGDIVEVFRAPLLPDFQPAQWNVMRSGCNVLRGFRCHVRHTDLLMVATGSAFLGLADLRAGSPSEGISEMIELEPATEVVLIPPGVGHGLYFPEQTMLVEGVSRTWSIDDEFGCRWDDPDLHLDWSCVDPVISDRDRNAGTLAGLRHEVRTRMGLQPVDCWMAR
jgi:dTDP-4-dehydrorhamnose 3,5-epimerase